MVKVLVVFYSTYGHIFKMAQSVVEGVKEADKEAIVSLKRVPETLSSEIIQKMGATEAQKSFESIPIVTVKDIEENDVIIFGTPTRFGCMVD
jgi:NAD(P)H dehydrogenase (quinone)